MTTQTRLASKTAQLLVVPFLAACAIGVAGFGTSSQTATVQAAPIAVAAIATPAAPAATGGFIDHSVVRHAPHEVPAVDLPSLSVAAYD
ncbi:MAG: hypothetical protein AD742_21445 [Methylibium sp. NZG]|nr:MAG: hypothetical protein AD742_21445 [Methylibium sp. NZG]